MSVYTVVTPEQIASFLDHYEVGELLDMHGVSEGIENTVYFVDTTVGRYVLTLFEAQKHEDLAYYLDLMNHVAQTGVAPTPVLLFDKQGQALRELCGKPATLVERLKGATTRHIEEEHCRAVGMVLAHLHHAICLLYTSPSPRDRQKSRMPSSA